MPSRSIVARLLMAATALILFNACSSDNDSNGPERAEPTATEQHSPGPSTTSKPPTSTTTARPPTSVTTSTQPSTTTSRKAPTARIALSVQVDSDQVNHYAIASSPNADFLHEALTCARRGKNAENERYCYLFPTQAAFEASQVDPETGEFALACWVAFGGRGTDLDTVETEDITVTERWLYDTVSGCPPY